MTRRYTLKQETSYADVPLNVYDERLGLFYVHEFRLHNIPISGTATCVPPVWGGDGKWIQEVEVDLDEDQVWDLLEEQADGSLDHLVLLDSPDKLLTSVWSQACNIPATKAVWVEDDQ